MKARKETMAEKAKRLEKERDYLLSAAKLGVKVAESWIHDQLDGTHGLNGALAELEPARKAIAKAEGGAR